MGQFRGHIPIVNINKLESISLSHKGQNLPFLGYCLPSWKILDNSNNVKSDF
jgi:hypothetical protein